MSRRKSQDKKQSMGTFYVGTVLGALVGAIAAFWYAPQSGKETRHDIQEKVEDVREDIEHTAKDVRQRIEGESISDTLEAAKAEARRYQETAKR
jgi:gas vesicle protein